MPSVPYFDKNGVRLPSVTSVIGHRKESGGLVHAAWKLGMEGRDYKVEWRSAADVGTMVHALVEAHINGQDAEKLLDPSVPRRPGAPVLTDEAQIQLARDGFRAYRSWLRGSRLEFTDTEVPLVCEEHRFGGCLDAIGKIGGELVLVDFKTGRTYPDHIIQLACYRHLWSTNYPDKPVYEGHLLRFDKDQGVFSHKQIGMQHLDKGWETFLHLLAVYRLDQELAKYAK